jgi:hypothetical protein
MMVKTPMKNEHTNRFDRLLQIRAPESLSIAIDSAAGQRFQSKSDYIRSAVVDRLRADGVDVARLAGAA